MRINDKLTNTDLSKLLGLPISKARRNSKEFLPPDPQASRQSGYTRTFDLNDGFRVFLGGHLVSVLGYSFEEARLILGEIWPWIKSVDLLPKNSTRPKGIDVGVVNFEVRILRRGGDFFYYVYGDIKLVENWGDRDAQRGVIRKTEKTTYLYTIGPHGGIFPAWDEGLERPEFSASKLLQVHRLLIAFLGATGTWREWSEIRGLRVSLD